jgi:hypothetical protein
VLREFKLALAQELALGGSPLHRRVHIQDSAAQVVDKIARSSARDGRAPPARPADPGGRGRGHRRGPHVDLYGELSYEEGSSGLARAGRMLTRGP